MMTRALISFRVNIPNRPQLTRDILAVLFVDSDANPATGDPDILGADYLVQLFLGEVVLFKWDGTDFNSRRRRSASDDAELLLGRRRYRQNLRSRAR